MSNWLFSNIRLLEKGLNATWLRNTVIANNIANVDTPGYKSSRVEFESILESKLQEGALNGKTTNPKHISINTSIEDANPIVEKNKNTTMRMDGNNVDIDVEMAELARNSIKYNALIEKTLRDLARIKTAIKEVR